MKAAIYHAFSHKEAKDHDVQGTRVSSEGLGLLDFPSSPTLQEMAACAHLKPVLLLLLYPGAGKPAG
uniref:Processing of precursor 4, ribonuclease P/MRP family, (S. cerevisiae) n=1 Tax=Mus musculus TaxID=10090 RepID=A0A0U1RQ13_MOUSE